MKRKTKLRLSHILSIVTILILLVYFGLDNRNAKNQEVTVSKIEQNLKEKKKDKSHIDANDFILNTLGVLYVPKIKLSLPIYEGTSERALSSGVGLWEASPGELGGGVGNRPLLTSHNGLSIANLFTQLPKLEKDDLFYIRLKDSSEILAYKVVKKEVLTPEKASMIEADKDKDLVTLMTCYPIFINSKRMLITGERTEYKKEQISTKKGFLREYWLIILLLILLLVEIIKLMGVENEKNN